MPADKPQAETPGDDRGRPPRGRGIRLAWQLTGVMLALSVVTAGTYTVLSYRNVKKSTLDEVDRKLRLAADLARQALPDGYHDAIRGAESVSPEAYEAIVARLDRLCAEHGLEYLWSVMEVDGVVRFTSGTSRSKDLHRDHAAFYEEHSNPAAYAEALQTMEVQYTEIVDKWGSLRAVLVPWRDARGRKHLFGAAMKLGDVDAMLAGILRELILVGVGLCLVGVCVSLLLGQFLARPLGRLTRMLRRGPAEIPPGPVPVEGPYEQRALAGTLNTLRETVRHTLEELHDGERRYRELADLLPQAICETDGKGKMTYANRQAYEAFGYTEADLQRGLTVFEMIVPEDRPRAQANAAEVFRGGQERIAGTEYLAIRKDGSTFPVLIYSTPVLREGRPVGMRNVVVDITDRKRAEAQQKRMTDDLRTVLNVADTLMACPDVDTLFRQAVESLRDKLGLERCSIFLREDGWLRGTYGTDRHGRTIPEHTNRFPADSPGWQKRIEAMRSEGLRWDVVEERHVEWNGHEAVEFGHGWIAFTPIPGGEGQDLIGVLVNDTARTGAPLDSLKQEALSVFCATLGRIIERKRAEEALRESETKYRTLVDSANDAIFFHDLEGRFLEVNEVACRRLGYTHEELMRLGPERIDASESAAKVRDRVAQIVKQGSLVFESAHLGRDGTIIPVEISARLVEYRGTKAVLSHARDITRRTRAEEERERLMSAVEQAAEAIVITDTDAVIEYVNSAFERITGYTRAEALGQNPRILQSGQHEEAYYQELWRTLQQGQTWTGRFVNRRKDGRLYTEEAVISPVRDTAGRIAHYVAVKRDITDQIRLETQLRQSQKMEAVGRLAGGVAHDFNNKLQIILGTLDLLQGKADTPAALAEGLGEIEQAAEQAAELTRQLLAFARRQTVSPKVLDLNETVGGMLKMLCRLLGENMDLEWLPADDVWPVRIDPGQVDQILVNLCVNARDAIETEGKVSIETANVRLDQAYCRTRTGLAPGPYVRLVVRDNGRGMPPEVLATIFEPFFTTKGPGQGTGLGLATVYGIVKQNEGFIDVQSEPGRGTTFTIYLRRHEHSAAAPTSPTRAEPVDRGRETILLVEDEPGILTVIQTILEDLGYHVLAAAGPGQAMDLARNHDGDIHLLVADVVMPEMNGRELAGQLLHLYPGMKRLFMSGYTADVIAHHGVLVEGTPFLEKPFSRQKLSARVRQILDED